MTIFSLTAPYVGVPICAPPFGEIKDNVNLEDIGLTNDDVAGYGFGFSQSDTEDVQVKPDFYVKLRWRPEYVKAEYRDDFCFHSLSNLVRKLRIYCPTRL